MKFMEKLRRTGHKGVHIFRLFSTMTAALDRLLPRYQFVERHCITVRAGLAATFATVETVDLSDSTIAKTFIALWRIPARLFINPLPERSMTVQDFIPLLREPPRDLVRGLVTGVPKRTWTADEFAVHDQPGFKLAWGFCVTDLGDGRCRVDTETRVLCCDAKTKRWFNLYWLVIRIPSGIIRLDMLRIIKQRVEALSINRV